jgi:hypothetical protein
MAEQRAAPEGGFRGSLEGPRSISPAGDNATPRVYGTSPVKRTRRTRSELAALNEAILTVCEADHPLSVRGVFYRVMSAGAVEKTEKGYSAVQRQVLGLRRAGALPYEWIADGTRWHVKAASWSSPKSILDAAAASYRRALWNDQNVYVEFWSEKEAISSIVAPITTGWDVPLMIARGFASESFLWKTAAAIRAVAKPTIVYNLGDHDPSGVLAWQHVQRRLREFAPDADITFERIAVTEVQIAELDLPTRPTKRSDSRAKWFVGESVDVDAIRSSVLRELVENAITKHIDQRALRLTRMAEESEKRGLLAMANGWRP